MAVDVALQQKAREGDGEFDPDEVGTDMEMPDVPNVSGAAGGNVPSNVSAPKTPSPPSSGASSGGVGRGGSTESTQHPALANYDALVNVRNDDEDE